MSIERSEQKVGFIRIDRPTFSDFGACAKMMAQSTPWLELAYSENECLTKLRAPSSVVKVAKRQVEVLGVVVYRRGGFSSAALISLVCVRPDVRNRGLGRALIGAVEENIFKDESNLFLTVPDFDTGAIQFFSALGYVRCGEIPDYHFVGQSELIFRKTTGPRRQHLEP